MKVLFVQNKPLLATALQLTFLRQGYEVVFCHTANDAIDNILKHRPGLIIVDMMVSSMGVDFISSLKNFQLPVIVMSAFGHEEQLLRAFEMGADDYVNIPYSLDELLLRTSVLTKVKPKGLA